MLKAVRFDDEAHKDLIKFIEDYRDSKNKPNHSEAIRLLMKKGLDNLSTTPKEQQIDIDKLKTDIFNQIMEQIKNVQDVQVAPNINKKEIVKEDKQVEPKLNTEKNKPTSPKTTNPLLANILNNSQR